ncbi:protein white isoform X2 [Tetranychus urticae]|uniref:protein white isoform X2 n=1 Tax=Tetranychus urticae TaxID=32264 RepID=UPI00077B90D6|nr:protein white isoform X2 [Tetranychus urticae]
MISTDNPDNNGLNDPLINPVSTSVRIESTSYGINNNDISPSNDAHFKPTTLSWNNLNVYSKGSNGLVSCFGKKKESVHIIKNITGHVKPGNLLAILGASGAGKTTLLNVLTGQNLNSLTIEGKVLLNNEPTTIQKLASCSAYVQQDDLFFGVLTVREHLQFQLELRTSVPLTPEQRRAKINKLLETLGLMKVAESRIKCSSTGQRLSGGELKRLSVATEILTDPAILFCDEPTSGLDSFMAQSVISVLKSMAAARRTVLATIHQPSSEVFEMFDEILLLSQGRVAFMGKSQDALSFFSQIGLQCPQNYNPSDFYIQKLAIVPGREEECKRNVEEICNKFSESQFAARMNKFDKEIVQTDDGYSSKIVFSYKRGFFMQMFLVLWRSWLTNLREPLLTSVRIAQTIFISLLLGLIYWRQEYNQEGIMNINGALFILLANITFTNVFAVVNTFCLELPIFIREHNNGLYSVSVYFISKTLAELPYFVLLPFAFASITYWMIGLYNNIEVFILAAFVLTLIANVACGFGYFISTISKSVTMALSLAPPFMIPLMLFGGLFLNNKSIPVYLAWIKYLSWFYYGNEILVVNQWRKVTNITCDIPETFTHIGSMLGNMSLPDDLGDVIPPGLGCILDGKGVIRKLNFDEDNITRNFIALGVLLIGFRILAFVSLSVKARLMR